MVRTFTLVALPAAGTIVGLSPGAASAQPPIVYPSRPIAPIVYPPRPLPPDHGHGHRHYTVLIRHRGHWDVHSTHHDRDDAQRVARRLEHRGYDARIERSTVR